MGKALIATKSFKGNLLEQKMNQQLDSEDVMNHIVATDDLNLIHIFIIDKKKRGKKLTRIKGLSDEFDFKKILAFLKKERKCNGGIKLDDLTGKNIIELSGDHREYIKEFLYEEGISEYENIRIHGV